ncbi:unnamed protein product, partial [Ectocarpus fasciculatus]
MKSTTTATMGIVPILILVLLTLSGTSASNGSIYRARNVDNEGNVDLLANAGTINTNLRSLQAEDSMCTTSDGEISGIQDKTVCCPVTCGQCGGSGCSGAPGGEESCCTSTILEAGEECGEPPCVIGESAPTPAPAPTPEPEPTPDTTTMCTADTEGVLSDNGKVCCALGCNGQCGGPGCSSFGTPDLGGESCCAGAITDAGVMCGGGQGAPCLVSEEEVEMCDGGIPGIQVSNVCCSSSCGSCGGS